MRNIIIAILCFLVLPLLSTAQTNDPVEKNLSMLVKRFQLDDSQTVQARAILKDFQKTIQTLNTSTTTEDRFTVRNEMIEERNTKIYAILSPEGQKKMARYMERRDERMKEQSNLREQKKTQKNK